MLSEVKCRKYTRARSALRVSEHANIIMNTVSHPVLSECRPVPSQQPKGCWSRVELVLESPVDQSLASHHELTALAIWGSSCLEMFAPISFLDSVQQPTPRPVAQQ